MGLFTLKVYIFAVWKYSDLRYHY